MKILYVTDLHGDPRKYEKTLQIALNENIPIIVNGGDILPKKGVREEIQPVFLENFLPDYFQRIEDNGLNYIVMLGNDDLEIFDDWFEELCSRYPHVYNVASRKIDLDGYEFIGMNYILDTPFPRKERIITEDNFSCEDQFHPEKTESSSSKGRKPIKNWEEVRSTLPKMIDVLHSLPLPDNPDKTVYIIHEPPAQVNLGRTDRSSQENRDIGSQDIKTFLKEMKASFSVHGHIHESPETGGSYFAKLGKTFALQPGQTEYDPNYPETNDPRLIYMIIDLDSKEFERLSADLD